MDLFSPHSSSILKNMEVILYHGTFADLLKCACGFSDSGISVSNTPCIGFGGGVTEKETKFTISLIPITLVHLVLYVMGSLFLFGLLCT